MNIPVPASEAAKYWLQPRTEAISLEATLEGLMQAKLTLSALSMLSLCPCDPLIRWPGKMWRTLESHPQAVPRVYRLNWYDDHGNKQTAPIVVVDREE